MATKKVSQGTRAPKKRAEKPVTRIKEAAESFPIIVTLGELCNPIAYDITPSMLPAEFALSALKRLAEDFDVLADLVERREAAGFESWKTMQGLRCRMEFTARVIAELNRPRADEAVAS